MARLRIAKTGGSVYGDPKDLVLDSDLTSLMIYDEQTLGSTATEYSHNLGYYPLVFAFFQEGTKWHPENSFVGAYSKTKQSVNTVYIENNLGENVKLFISGNAVDNAVGSGKNTAIGRLKIAKPGYNAETETDIRRFQFCSGLDLIKKDLNLRGTITFTTDTGYSWEEEKYIEHNLGYVPLVFATDYAGTMGFGGELPLHYSEGLNNFYYYVTSTRVYFGVSNFSKYPSVETYTFQYQIYRNKIA